MLRALQEVRSLAAVGIRHRVELLDDSIIQAYLYARRPARPSSRVIEPGTPGVLSAHHPEDG